MSILTIEEFLINNNYTLYQDKFWDSITKDKWIYINTTILEWMEYIPNVKNNKNKYIELLKNNFTENTDFKHINTLEFKKIHTTIGIDLHNINLHNKTKHLVVSPKCFKQTIMMMQTDKAKKIRKNYLIMEKYMFYQFKFNNEFFEQMKNKVK
jgi:MSV199 domain-containing protein